MFRGDRIVQFIVGKRGSGKSELAKKLIERIDCKRILFYDSNGHDYKDGVVCNGLAELRTYWRRVIAGSHKIIFRSANPRADFDEVCRLVMAAGNLVFVVDEVDMYFDDAGQASEAFGDVIRRGRHEDIEFVGITQRPRRMGEIRSMADKLYIFDTHEPSDLSYFRQSFSDALVEKIKQLRQYEYVKVELPYDETALLICKEKNVTPAASTGAAEMDRQTKPGGALGLHAQDGGDHSQEP
jgi:hypothetical protein